MQIFTNPLSSSILFFRARQGVRDARLHLDSWKQTLKVTETTGKAEKLEAHRAEVEGAEDKLVSATEEAIALMKNVLDNPVSLWLASFWRFGSEAPRSVCGFTQSFFYSSKSVQEPIKSLNAFVKAWVVEGFEPFARELDLIDWPSLLSPSSICFFSQAEYHKAAAELLTELAQEISQQAMAVESDYRSSRG